MNFHVVVLIVIGGMFLLYGLLIRKTTFYIGYYNKEKYSRVIKEKVLRGSSYITSLASFILAILIYQELLQNLFVMFVPIVWGISNMTLLRIYVGKTVW